MATPTYIYEVLADFDYKGFDFYAGDIIHSFCKAGRTYTWVFTHQRRDPAVKGGLSAIRTVNVQVEFIGQQIQAGRIRLIGKTSE